MRNRTGKTAGGTEDTGCADQIAPASRAAISAETVSANGENVLLDIHERFIEPLLEAAREIEARQLPPDQTVRALAAALVHDIADYRDQVTVALHEWRTIVASKDRERVARVRHARGEFEQVVARAMERGQAEGMFTFERPRLAVLGFLGMINYAYQWSRPDTSYGPDELAAAFSDFFIDAIRVR